MINLLSGKVFAGATVVAFVATVVLASGMIIDRDSQIARLSTTNGELVTAIGQRDTVIGQLKSAIQTQNQHVQNLQASALEMERKSTAVISTAKSFADSRKRKAIAVISSVIPNNMTLCDAAEFVINEEISHVD